MKNLSKSPYGMGIVVVLGAFLSIYHLMKEEYALAILAGFLAIIWAWALYLKFYSKRKNDDKDL
ncbi:hypothetical protein [Streptococcus gallinaceus]|uniref:Uncharacterized protein n=1 Tax=Streptococcus gallinaceus TaxID=165758 RepID=A0ABV2JQ94_9STRE|nr:hypothetical protein [Streptococcus gallinaceus]MCP1640081.1 hypothetical protein [Streptococcus gallinaceus]MCP1770863.1 hypothetical protein [Streptococcus gallinaceus]CRH92434.1 Uncharacterised protein [Chlamydia trachomatis]